MIELSQNMPKTAAEAGAYIFTVTKPTLDDLKVMVLLEASGQGFYAALAEAAPNEEVRALLAKNGQEEMGHAHRVARVIKQLFGEDFAVPGPEENPYYMKPAGFAVTGEMLDGITQGETAGEALYDGWATYLGDAEAARQLRQNGKEERGHGERAQQAKALLPA
ncbi:MAG TPA: ferritin family protein [Alphaproteobacteria bacterium]|jgi:rubrerythrin|nr:ferritin family protein [Alphaproteobacteria bacterium]